MPTIKEILTELSSSLVNDLKNEIPKVTGNTANSVEGVVTDKGFQISANASVGALIEGRRPTSNSGSSGGKTLQQVLLEWIKAKGITPYALENGKTPTQEALSYMMANSMHKKGNLLYQRGGRNNLLDGINIESRLSAFLNTIGNRYADDTVTQLALK